MENTQKHTKFALLDTSFIISCVRNKIDFFEELSFIGFRIAIPEGVIKELEGIKNTNKKLRFREEAEFALKMIKVNNFKKVKLDKKTVDNGIISYAKKHENVYVASLDREIKAKTSRKIVIRGKNQLEVI